MTAQGGEHIYATLLLSDSYLPGALVLAHSLRDAGTNKQLAVLVTLDSVSAESITQLKTVYDYVIPVPRIRNDRPANLYLMNRADLHSAFTKINLWKQTQFSKIVYIDADVVAYRAPDELFSVPHAFAAAPDIGWPDLFNTGVMVLTPNMGDYYAMMAMAERGISFDGADQGLINMHFSNNYHRLSFTYNVTPSAHYQYVPAYRHFQSSINMVHFIGSNKPWFSGRDATYGNSPFDEMVGRWWAVYDRHYRAKETTQGQKQPDSNYVQYFTKGEFHPQENPAQSNTAEHREGQHNHHHQGSGHVDGAPESHRYPPPPQQHQQHDHHHPHHDHPQYHPSPESGHEQHGHKHHEQPQPHDAHAGDSAAPYTHPVPSVSHDSGVSAEARSEQQVPEHHGGGDPTGEHRQEPASTPAPVQENSWDAQRQPPPPDSKPEAMNFPSTHYEMSEDITPFVPPKRYPSPPKNMWYEVPKTRPAPPEQQPRAIFPWETQRPQPSRTFIDTTPQVSADTESYGETFGERMTAPDSRSPTEPSTVESAPTQATTIEPMTPTTPTIKVIPSDPWTSFPRNNAWDDVPEIGRYVEGLQKHRRVRSQGTVGGLGRGRGAGWPGSGQRDNRSYGFRLTDFPSEAERPSLPVTPAPIHRPTFWGDDDVERGDDDESKPPLPAAEGVPAQEEWVCVHGKRWGPADCLCALADLILHHKDPAAQLQKLAKQQSEALLRRLSGGEMELSGQSREIPSRSLPYGSEFTSSDPPAIVAHTATGVLSPRPLKIETRSIPEPSYSGPGAAWEKGEDAPTHQTPLPPTEDERDILET